MITESREKCLTLFLAAVFHGANIARGRDQEPGAIDDAVKVAKESAAAIVERVS